LSEYPEDEDLLTEEEYLAIVDGLERRLATGHWYTKAEWDERFPDYAFKRKEQP